MKEISVQEAIQLRKIILGEFDNFCKLNNIQYSLGYGTLLGAIRHKDMIPWDDDIDVVVLRSEFDKLETLSQNGGFDGERFTFVTHRTNPEIKTKIGYYMDTTTVTCISGEQQPFGVHIDIFPMDALPENVLTKALLLCRRKFLHCVIKANGLHPQVHTGMKKYIRQFIKFFGLMFNVDRCIDRLNRISKNSNYEKINEKDGWVLVETGAVGNIPMRVFDEYSEYEYADKKYMGINDSDVCLKAWYGDYMTPPKPEHQVLYVNPNVKYYWKN